MKNNGQKMNTNRKTAIIVGVLYIVATVAGIISKVFGLNLDAPDFLANLSANEDQVILIINTNSPINRQV